MTGRTAPAGTRKGGVWINSPQNEGDYRGLDYRTVWTIDEHNGELYNVTFSRDRVTISSYSDDAIRTKVETWADTETALA